MRAFFCILSLFLGLSSPVIAAEMEFFRESSGGNCSSCAWLRADGEIRLNTPERLLAFLKKESPHEGMEVRLNSPGGNLMAGLRLGEIIRQYKLNTVVGTSEPFTPNAKYEAYSRQRSAGSCASACSFAFLGGVLRSAKAGEVGVHQFYQRAALATPDQKLFSANDVSSNQALSGQLLDFAVRMGADPGFVMAGARTRPDAMHYFDAEELSRFRISWDPASFKPWTIEPYRSGIVANSTSHDETLSVTVFCRADRVPRMMFTTKVSGSAHKMYAVEAVERYLVFGFRVEQTQLKVAESPGIHRWEAPLIGFNIDRVATTQKAFSLVPDGSFPSMGWSTYTELNPAGAPAAFRAALKNCI